MRYLDERTIIGSGGTLGAPLNVALAVGVNVISHNLGVKARNVEFLVGDISETFTWVVNAGDPLNKIDVTVDEIEASVDVNVIGY